MEVDAINGTTLDREREEEDITFQPDSNILRQIIPEEIWKIVTKNLLQRSPDDLESLANSSTFFRNMLAPHRTGFLFQNAFQITSLTIWKREGVQGPPVRDVLKCRGICSHWNSAVDKLICKKFQYVKNSHAIVSIDNFQVPIDETFQKVARNEFEYRRPPIGYTLAVVKFLEYFCESHPLNGRSPFIGTTVSIRYPIITEADERNQIRYLEGVSTLLHTYGSHIKHLTLFIDDNVQYFTNVRKMRLSFLLLPNLQTLKIFCDVTGCGPRGSGYNEDNVFPKWKNLKILETSRLPSVVFNQLIRKNNHVSSLIVRKCEANCNFFTFGLPNLRKLEIEIDTMDLIKKLRSPQVQWPLEHLKIDFSNRVYLESGVLFQVIREKFANTLTSLSLSINHRDGRLCEGLSKERLELPKLKNIELVVNGAFVCLNFLLPMRESLEEIKVTNGYTFPYACLLAKRGDIVQFGGFERKMMESNIWAIFKRLRKIEVVTNSDTVPIPRYYFRKDLVKGN